jgi:hypothetical protein
MRGFRPSLAAILPLLLVAAAAAQVPAGEPGFDVVGRWAPGAPAALVLDGRLAYLGHGARLEAVHLDRPETPKRLGYVDYPSAVTGLAARDGYLYVTTSDGQFSVVDARRPRQLREVGRLEPTGDVSYGCVALADGVAYCAGGSLSVIDLGVPAAPRVVRDMPMPLCSDVAVDGHRLYVAAADGLHVLDIADPQAPVPLEIVGYGDMEQPWWLQAHEGKVYAGNNHGVFVYCLADSARRSGYLLEANGYVSAVAFAGAEVYVAGPVVTKCVGASCVPDWMLSELGAATAVAVDGDRLVVAYQWSGLASYALDDTGQPRLLGVVETGTPVESVTADGDRLWLACNRGGVRLLDLSDPAHPRQAGSLAIRPGPQAEGPPSLGMWAMGVFPRGDMAVVLGLGEVNLLVVEATPRGTLREVFRATPVDGDPASPFHTAVATSDGWIVCGETGTYGLRVDRRGGVEMTPITWPAGLSPACRADGEVLYAFDQQRNLCLLKATAAGEITRLGSVPLAGLPSRLASARNGLIWLSNGLDLQIVDIGDPRQPRLRGRARLPFERHFPGIDALAAAGSVAFALSRCQGLALAEARDPDAPVVERFWYGDRAPVEIAAVGGMACLFDRDGTMTVLRPQPRTVAAAPLVPAQTARLHVAPNPCNPRATITFTMADAGPATVRVFDARGRLVRRLHDGRLEMGAHDLSWSGDDDNGRPVATGVYLVRAESAGHAETARVTVVK